MQLLGRHAEVPSGYGEFQKVSLEHVARGVYRVEFPPPGADFEYRIEAEFAQGEKRV